MASDQPPSSGSPAKESEEAAERRDAESAGAAKAAYAAEAVSPWSEPGSGSSAAVVDASHQAHRHTIWLSIGAGLAGGILVAIALVPAGLVGSRDDAELDGRLTRIEQQVRDLAARPQPAASDAGALEELTNRLARLEAAVAAPRPAATDTALANRVSTIEGEVKALVESVGILGRRSDDAVAAAREAATRAEVNAAAVAELSQKLARQAPAADRIELDALAARVAAVERNEKSVEAELAKRPNASPDRVGRLAIAASVLNAAVERGAPFAAELATAKALAPDPETLAPLEPFANSGVPSAPALSRQLAALVPALRAATGDAPRENGVLDRLAANAEKLVRIHPLKDVAGSDPGAVISRIEVKATQSDIPGALAGLAQLPAPARAPAEAWIKQAQARSAALDASRRLAADALAGLGK
jgi:hypothetical protein